MPELPEVETVRRGLEPVLGGRRILRAEVRRPGLRWPFPPDLAVRLAGSRVVALGRRSKYLLAELDRGETLIVHLGMSGRMLVTTPQAGGATDGRGAPLGLHHHDLPLPGKHDHLVIEVEGGARVTFNDARRFGSVDLWPTEALGRHRLLAALGPEPLGEGFDARRLLDRAAGRRVPLKALLLDQRVVAGLGNIYVCEALWRAGLSPFAAAGSLDAPTAAALVAEVRAVLLEAIAAGGSSLRDHRRTDGELGYFQHSFAVYGRAGRACLRPGCTGTVARGVQSGRSSFHCPACQAGRSPEV